MKPSSNTVNGNHQKRENKREDKKGINTRWNSTIFFQIGIIVMLLLTVFAMEIKVGDKVLPVFSDRGIVEEPPMTTFVVDVPKPTPLQNRDIAKVAPRVVPPKVITTVIDVVPDTDPIITAPVATVMPPVDTPVVNTPVKDSTPPVVDTKPKYANSVEFAPVFPGCESLNDNESRINCMSAKISAFVSRKFNTDVADDDTNGTQKIYVQFKIDKLGNVTDVKASSSDKDLQKEAQRVVAKLPKMTPGKMGEKSVDVLYMLPITFQLQ